MKNKNKVGRRLTAMVMAIALVITGSCVSSLVDSTSASAAGKAKVSLNKTSLSMTVGKKKTLKVKTTKKVKEVKKTTWSSNKKKVASVTKKGVVKAKKAGTATIKCQVKYVPKKSKKAKTETLKCKVTVKEKEEENRDLTASFDSGDTTSNVGAEHENENGITVTDNGTMREELSATELLQTEMGLGINLGNTMEATVGTLEEKYAALDAGNIDTFEKAWGNPVTTKALFESMKSYGINTVRIPVAWSSADRDDGTYTLDSAFMDRVEEIVNYALDLGMYVVINDHWDYQWWGQFGACKYEYDENGNRTKVADEQTRAAAWDRYESYWTQIADRFKGYSDHLLFESANEELGDRLNDSIYSTGYCIGKDENDSAVSGNLTKSECYEMMNQINQKFVDIVRASGGNNTSRHLVIAGYNTNIQDTADARFVMPIDSANTVNKLFVSVHFYTPWNFCGDGSDGDYTDDDYAEIVSEFSDLQRFVDEGYPVFVGEMSVCNPTGVKGDVVQWFTDVFNQCSLYNAIPCIWDTGEYFNRRTGALKFKDMAELFNSVTGANGDTSMERMTGIANLTDEESDFATLTDVSTLTPVWSWTGRWYKNGGDNTVGDDRYEDGGGTNVSTLGITDSDERLSYFVPESVTTPTIDGDETQLYFNDWGYQAWLYVDLSKYEEPAISFTFLDGTATDDNVGAVTLGAATAAYTSPDESNNVSFADYDGMAITLNNVCKLSSDAPYLYITFGNKPIVTGITLYDLAA